MKTILFLWGFAWAAPSPHEAAQRIINTFYQSCDAAKKAPYDVEASGEMRGYLRVRNDVTQGSNPKIGNLAEARASQYYISCGPGRKTPKGCRNLCDAPPTYVWGGMGRYEKTAKGLTLDLFRNTEPTQSLTGHPGLDCSGLVHAIFATAGLRVNPELAPSSETADRLTARTYMKPGACFNDVALGAKNTLRPGDVIAWKTHLMMVDSAGEDPFGLAKIASLKSCTLENLDPDAFGLVIINSKGGTDPLKDEVKALVARNAVLKRKLAALEPRATGVGVGISKLKLQELAVIAPGPIMELALAACYAKFGAELPADKALNKKPWRETINVVRHRLTEDGAAAPPDDPCRARPGEEIRLEGFECVKDCPP